MMKSFIILALVITIAAASETNSENEKCEAASVFYDKCNKCRCANDGNGAVCTRKQCIPGEYDGDGVLIKPHHEINKRSVCIDYPDLPEGNCEFGKTYRKDCNTCFCGKMGVTACTMKECGADVVYYSRKSRSANENWGPRYNQGDLCEPGKKFFSECNECHCNTDSKSAICTLKMCPPHQE
ncbi:hypothetical protein PV327_003486 [Microctonus hyperodae]|uniref:Pacifastin domain-containing protein n=1 Tax=Microctonus hyperodae TaxID=165561 RepID=A0AA39L141_MICHY|nr:hypothetical protein PV327_003486 [Microctonus hyperodae]